MQSASAHARSHLEHLARRKGRGVAGDGLGDEGRQAYLLKHIQIVVGRRAVGPDPDIQPRLQHLRDRGETRSQLEVAGWVVGDAGVRVLECVHLTAVDMDAVGGDDFGLQQPLFLHPGHHWHIVGLPPLLDLLGGLGDVDVEGDIVFLGQIGAGVQDLSRARVGGMRRDGGDDQIVVLPSLDKAAGGVERVLP